MDYLSALAIAITVIGAVWGHAIWLSSQFLRITKDFDSKFEKFLETIVEKLEYHERHDDRRFSEISNSIWEIRLQTALGSKQVVAREGRETEKGGV